MANWYYADAERQRQGPLTADEIAQRFHQGKMRLDTLVWRDGLADWQPLRDFTSELALHQAPAETFYTPVEPTDVATAAPAPAGPHPRIEPVFGNDAAEASPYLPPTAALTSDQAHFTGAEVVYAGFWKRFAAACIDGLILGVVLLIVMLIGIAIFGGLGAFSQMFASGEPPGAMFGLLLVGLYGVPIVSQAIYFTWMHASGGQATLGKMAVGIKVTRGDGARISTSRSLGRWAGMFFFQLFSCGLAQLASAIMCATTDRKQALHDMASDTLVVDKWAYTAHPEWQRRELGAVTITIIALAGLVIAGYLVMIVFAIGMGARGSV
ncbi:MAG: RDD family protein [Lysobacteraceae bacterium]|nr:MAG: RDD family protein [Xanthomonadaceae bacterium]